ncbi:hypothetical protein WJX84_011199 [Apatococcus fuscideae]|uniref:Fatty acid desaturase domain-containing protein n=1 Tax=Apatococcus fuscideae TaxID=2026836 RepID=A0AAW1SUQ6_9CHLO
MFITASCTIRRIIIIQRMYWLRFVIAVWCELPAYAWRSGNKRLALRLSLSLVSYWVSTSLLWRLNKAATLWVFIIPFFATSFALMFGNWSQHIFIDQDCPGSAWTSTYNCIGCSDNQKSFNDGYHIIHHLAPGLHWSELPKRFTQTLVDHAEHKALLFEGIGFFDVGLAVFCRHWHVLLKHLLILDPQLDKLPPAEKIRLLKSRLSPVQ